MITTLIVAASENDVIGSAGELPWYLPEDMRRFKSITSGHPVVVGRVTYESILLRLGSPLPNRTSLVVSRRRGVDAANVRWAGSVDLAFSLAHEMILATVAKEIFVIGGASIYRQALPLVDRILLTRVNVAAEGDCRMPSNWLEGFALIQSQEARNSAGELSYSFLEYARGRP